MKKLMMLFLLFFLKTFIGADIAHGVLEKYKNEYFVCTGIWNSISIARAMNANFAEIHCIDCEKIFVDHARIIVPNYYRKDMERQFLREIYFYHGEPKKMLMQIIHSINGPITFLLNSHLPEIDHPEKTNSILAELEQIKKHQCKQHSILIEYVNYADTPYFGNIQISDIITKILEINPNYKFRFEKGGHLQEEENAILAAYL